MPEDYPTFYEMTAIGDIEQLGHHQILSWSKLSFFDSCHGPKIVIVVIVVVVIVLIVLILVIFVDTVVAILIVVFVSTQHSH